MSKELSPVSFGYVKKVNYTLVKKDLKNKYYSSTSFKPEKFYKPIFKL